MSCGIVRVQKMSSGSVKGIQIHDRREKEGASHTNPDIDWSQSHQNYDLHPAQNENFNRVVKERIGELNLTRAVRKDAVVMAQVLVTSDHDYFDKLTPEQTKKFFEDSYNFLADRYGKENIVSSVVHMDERTPHMHFNFVPVTEDGRLAAKNVLTRPKLIEQQDQFAEKVGKNHGLERGMTKEQRIKKGVDRKNMTMPEFKGYMHEMNQLEKQVDEMAQEAATRSQEVDKLSNEVKFLHGEKSALQGQLEAMQGDLKKRKLKIKEILEIKPEKGLMGSVKGVTVDDIENLKTTAIRGLEFHRKYKDLSVEHQKIKGLIPSMQERIQQGKDKIRLSELEKAFQRLPKDIQKQLLSTMTKNVQKER